jgi:hypothetical protein
LRQISSSSKQLNEKESSEETFKTVGSTSKSRISGFKIVAFALTGFTIGLGFVAFDQDSRNKLTNAMPFTSSLFNYIDELVSNTKKSIPFINQEIKTNTLELPVSKSEKSKTIKPTEKKAQPVAPIIPVELNPKEKLEEPKLDTLEVKVEAKEIIQTPEPVEIQKNFESVKGEEVKPVEVPKELNWKETLKKFELQEEAAVDG